VLVLSKVHLKLCSRCLAELVTVGLKHGRVYLPLILDNVNGNTMLVGGLGDPHCTLVLPNDAAVVLKPFDECGSGGGHHLKFFIPGKLLASLFVYALTQLA
jgi:hypothetical protein